MLKGNWHLVAIGAFFSVMALKTNNILLFSSILFIWLIFLYVFKRISLLVVLTTLISFSFFYYYFPTYETLSSSFPYHFDANRTVTISGTIVSEIEQTEQHISFTLLEKNTNIKIRVTYFEQDTEPLRFPFTYNATCTMKGKLQSPNEATNPFEFNYKKFLFEKGIFAEFVLDSLNEIECKQKSSFLQQIYSIRQTILNKSNNTLHPTIAAWQQALIFGNSNQIDDSIHLLFQRWGLSHLLAISGLHVGIIIAIIYFLLIRLFQFTKEKARLIVLMFLPIYALLAGGQPSVWRASLMTAVVLIMASNKIKLTNTDVLSIVFLSLLLLNKFIIYHVGFQFSFAVTFGLLLSTNWFKQSKNSIENTFKISFIAQMMIVPLQMYYFYHFQPLSIVVNVLIVPYFSLFVIPFMFFCFFLFVLPDKISTSIEVIFITVHQLVLNSISLLDQYVNLPFVTGEITLEFTFIYYAFLIIMMIYLGKGNKHQAFRYGMLLTLTLTLIIAKPYFSKVGTVTMLDIGQGDAFVIELPYRKGVFLIDAGATFDFETFEPSESVFKRVIRPYLMGRGIQTIDTIFITHADLDHHGSVRYIIEQFNVKELVVHPFFNTKDKEFEYWLQNKTNITKVSYTDIIKRNEQSFYVLGPKQDKHKENENSLVLYTNLGGVNWLFTGDISKEEEREIAKQFNDLDVDILKVAHHGSNTSTDEQLLITYRPKYAFISVGRKNRYGHPSSEVIKNLTNYEVVIMRTDENGAVQFKYDKEKAVILPFLNQ